MNLRSYKAIWEIPVVRNTLMLGLFFRLGVAAGAIILTLHITKTLGTNYFQASLIVTVYTIFVAVSGPWRGRLLDRLGLRRTLAPSIIILTILWPIASVVGYWWLLALAVPLGLFGLPAFGIVRQVLGTNVPVEHRRTAMALDSVLVEFSYIFGPVLAILVATYFGTVAAIITFQAISILGGVALYIYNPPLMGAAATPSKSPDSKHWINLRAAAILLVSSAGGIVVGGLEFGIVPSMREIGHEAAIGWVVAIHSAGSAIGGLAYGAFKRPLPSSLLMLGFSLGCLPVALGNQPLTIALFLFVCGLFCAPALSSTVEALSRAVRPEALGEAMGWHQSVMTVGASMAPLVIGAAIDSKGWQAGFIVTGTMSAGIVLSVVILTFLYYRFGPGTSKQSKVKLVSHII